MLLSGSLVASSTQREVATASPVLMRIHRKMFSIHGKPESNAKKEQSRRLSFIIMEPVFFGGAARNLTYTRPLPAPTTQMKTSFQIASHGPRKTESPDAINSMNPRFVSLCNRKRPLSTQRATGCATCQDSIDLDVC